MDLEILEIESIEDIRQALAAIIDWLSKNRYISDILYNYTIEDAKQGDSVVIPLNKPEAIRCEVCGYIHGDFRSIEEATSVMANDAVLPECHSSAHMWLVENAVLKKEEKHE